MDTKALRQKVLDLAIRGKLVPQDPNDEPASVLLERIRAEKQRLVKEGKLKAKDIKGDTIIFVGDDNLHYEKYADGSVKCIEDEIPFDLPEGWAWTRIWSISFDLPYGTAQKSASTGKIAVLRMGNIQSGEIDYSDLVYSSDDSDIKKYALHPNDLLFNRTNSAEWVGKTAIYRGDIPAIYAGYLIRLRTQLCAEYLNAVMNSAYAKDYCIKVKTDGVNQSNINAQKLGAFLVPVPPETEQLKIAAYIRKLLPLIEIILRERTDISELIQKAKSKILDLAIRGQLVSQNPDDEPATVLLERIRAEKESLIKAGKIKRDKKESVIFRGDDNSYYEKMPDSSVVCIDEELPFDLPEGWEWVKIKHIADLKNGRAFKPSDWSESGLPIVRIQNLNNPNSEFNFYAGEVETDYYLHGGELLFAWSGTPGTSFGAHIWRNYSAVLNQHIFRIDFSETNIDKEFLKSAINHRLNELIAIAHGGAGLMHINRATFENVYIPLPPYAEQKRIVIKTRELTQFINKIESALV